MRLTDEEQAMRDGRDGPAVAKAMDLLIRYGEALGAERLVETQQRLRHRSAPPHPSCATSPRSKGGMDAVFSEFNLDSAEVVPMPKVKAFSSHLQLGFDPHQPERWA